MEEELERIEDDMEQLRRYLYDEKRGRLGWRGRSEWEETAEDFWCKIHDYVNKKVR